MSYCGPDSGDNGGPVGTPAPTGSPCNANAWTAWGDCAGSPAVKWRVNQCGTLQNQYCKGNIQSRAVVVNRSDISCTAVNGSATGLDVAIHQFTPGSASNPVPQTQNGANYVTFSNIYGGTYTQSPIVPANYVLVNACWAKSLNTPHNGTGMSTTLSAPTDADTLTWNLGYVLGTPWAQTQAGNVYAAGDIKSHVPSGITPRAFNLDGTGGYPGLVTYGTDYDFDANAASKGEALVSSTKWLANQTHASMDYYQYFYHKLGAPTTQNYDPAVQGGAKPADSGVYYVNGNMATSGDWSVGAGESIIFLVNGNLAINGKINLTSTSFIAFIVSGNITVDSGVGVPYSSTTPVIEGIYVTSPTGTFATGTSTVGIEKLVAKGMFIAGSFLLQRDNGDNNTQAPSELFIYNPQLWFTMPESMKDMPITWQEVAP